MTKSQPIYCAKCTNFISFIKILKHFLLYILVSTVGFSLFFREYMKNILHIYAFFVAYSHLFIFDVDFAEDLC